MASPKIQHWGPASYRYYDTKNHHIVAKRLKRKEKFGLEHSDAILQALFRLCKVKSMVEISWRTLYVGLRVYVRTAEYLNKGGGDDVRRWKMLSTWKTTHMSLPVLRNLGALQQCPTLVSDGSHISTCSVPLPVGPTTLSLPLFWEASLIRSSQLKLD